MGEVRRALARDWFGGLKRALFAGIGLALLLAISCLPVGRSQAPPGSNGGQGSTRPYYPGRPDTDLSGELDPVMMERRLNALNLARQKEMISDTNKLLKLVQELNNEVTAKNAASLTEDQLHKIAEIEKLAHNVKEKMANGVGQPSQSAMPPLIYPIQ